MVLAASVTARLLVAAALIVAAATDLKRRIIPNGCSLAVLAARAFEICVLAASGSKGLPGQVLESILGALAVAVVLLVPALILRSRSALVGGGDVKLLASLGAFLGWRLALVTVAASGALGAAAGLIHWVRTKRAGIAKAPQSLRAVGVPLAPAIALACTFALLL